jgi:ligand-binding SRPBCC domain-containing protein
MQQLPTPDRCELKGRIVQHSFELPGTSIETVFALFSDPRQLDGLTPRWFSLTVKGPFVPHLRPGSRIDYRSRWRGVPLRWRSLITEYEPPSWLVYEQDRGPFRHFRHEHSFEATEKGVEITDTILYRTVGGPWVDRSIVEPDLRRILRYRDTASRKILVPSR